MKCARLILFCVCVGLVFVITACRSESDKTNGADVSLLLVYNKSGGVQGIWEQLVIHSSDITPHKSEYEVVEGFPKSPEIYKVSPEKAKQIIALLNKESFFRWRSMPETRIMDTFEMSMEVTRNGHKHKVTVYDRGKRNRQTAKMAGLVEHLQALVSGDQK